MYLLASTKALLQQVIKPETGAEGDEGSSDVERVRQESRARHSAFGGPRRAMARTFEIEIPAGQHSVRTVVHSPPGNERPRAVVIYYHGGGLVFSAPDDYVSTLTGVAAASDAVVVAPDYRLAPEHPFPAPLEDAYSVLRWVQQNAASIGGDPNLIFTVGDSAGGYLVLAVAVEAARHGTPQAFHQIPLYPQTDMSRDYSEISPDYDFDADVHQWVRGMREQLGYVINLHCGDADRRDPRVSPIYASDFAIFPRTTMIAARLDLLLEEGREFCERLRSAGVPTQYFLYEGVHHGFVDYGGLIDVADDAIEHIGGVVRANVARSQAPYWVTSPE